MQSPINHFMHITVNGFPYSDMLQKLEHTWFDMEEYENVRPDIPGLVETEKSKKGKKKSNSSKKTLSLQNFLQDEPGVAASGESAGSDAMESHFAKLNLDEEVRLQCPHVKMTAPMITTSMFRSW